MPDQSEPGDDGYEGLARDVRRVAVHEAGHAVVAQLLGYDVAGIEVDLDTGWEGVTGGLPEDLPFAHAVTIGLAGFAAVGVILGPEEEQANRDIDDSEREGSDCDRIFKALEQANIPADEQIGVIDTLDADLRTKLARPQVGDMIEELVVEVEEKGRVPGFTVRATVDRHLANYHRETGADGNPFHEGLHLPRAD